MKLKLLLAALIFPFIALAQRPDTVGVARQVDSLIKESQVLLDKRDFGKAMSLAGDAEKLALETTGEESVPYLKAAYVIARIYYSKRDYPEAERRAMKVKEGQGKVLGVEHRDYATTLFLLGNIYFYRSNFADDCAAVKESLDIREKIFGKSDQKYAGTLSYLGYLEMKRGNYDVAESSYNEYTAFVAQKYGKNDSEYGLCLVDFAFLYFKKSEYEKSEPLFLESLSILEKTIGKENWQYALTLNYLGALYDKMGYSEKIEPIYLQTLAIQKNLPGRENQYAITLDNLGKFYLDLGDFGKSESIFLKAQAMYEKTIGKENPNYQIHLNGMASLYSNMGRFEESDSLLIEVLSIVKKAVGKKHLDYAMVLDNISKNLIARGDFASAELNALEGKVIYEDLALTNHLYYSSTLMNLALIYKSKGQYPKSEGYMLEARNIQLNAVGDQSKDYSKTLNSIADLYWVVGNWEATHTYLLDCTAKERALFRRAAQMLSDRDLSTYVNQFSRSLSRNFSFIQSQPAWGGGSGYDDLLFNKGFLLNTSVSLSNLQSSNPDFANQYAMLRSYRRQLAEEYSKLLSERKNLDDLEEKANTLEKDLIRSVAEFGQITRQVKWQEVQAALKPGEAAIEFVDYQYFDPKPTDSVMYAALLIHPGDVQPQFIPLFEKKELLPLLRGATGGNNFLKINALYASKPFADGQKSPYELIWKPLEQALKNTSTVYCSPSGLLHYLNLAAIPKPDGKHFGDARHLVLLGSTRSLAVDSKERSLVIPNAANNALKADAYLAGGIRYESDSTAISMSIASSNVGTRSIETTIAFQPDSSATRAGDLNYLPATATEVREIGQMLRAANFSAKVDTGFFASEEAFRSLGIGKPSPRILHLATHGYFFPDPKGKKTNAGQEPVFKMSEHPMIRSGLIMAGAKQAWLTGKHPEGQEDGILTAYEISQMNLSNTELVVLSACETGLGQVSGNEGVYGLQRAFKVAGVKYLIMSLWKVDDRSTQAFMAEFYKQWLQGKQPIPEAFRAAQKSMRAKSPGAYDWAGFVLIE